MSDQGASLEAAVVTGQVFGAVLFTALLALLVRVILRLFVRRSLPAALTASSYLAGGILGIVMGAYGYADGGAPQWVFAASIYAAPALLAALAVWLHGARAPAAG